MNSECVFTKISYLQRQKKLSHKELLLLVDYCNDAEKLDKDRFETLKSMERDYNGWVGSFSLATIRCEELIGKRNNNLIAILTKTTQRVVMENVRTLSELDNIAPIYRQ